MGHEQGGFRRNGRTPESCQRVEKVHCVVVFRNVGKEETRARPKRVMLSPHFVLEEWLGEVLNTPVAPSAMDSFVAESTDSQPEEWDETVAEEWDETVVEEWDETVRLAEEWLINHPLYTIEGVRMNLDGNE